MRLEILRPLHIRHLAGGEDLHLKPGPVDLPDDDAMRLLVKKPDAVRPVVQPSDLVEWLSPALPKQQGEALAVGVDSFLVFHPLSECVCQLPIQWITRVVTAPTNPEESR